MQSIGSSRLGVYDGKIAGLYDLEETLGSGHFAVVKLARHVFTGEKVAVKVIDKTKLDEVSRAHLFQEVRCMKLVQHPNVVRLYEVIDTQTKLYLILELGDGGDLYDYIMKHEGGLSESFAREYFRQIVRAISYCHQLHVVHRDLKPENVVFFEKLGVVKLTDFGFSNKFCPGQKLETSCGSLAYSAPEILLGDSYDAPAVDIWSLGVILYMLVCGHPPFQEANDSETLTMIMDCKYTMPAHVSDSCRHLISRMLVREPDKRATLQMIAQDKWLTPDGSEHVPEYLPLVSRQQVSEEDHTLIIQKMVNGNIAGKEEILEALDKNEYNHITATYFLLAERKLRAYRQEQAQKRRPEQLSLAVPLNSMRLSPNKDGSCADDGSSFETNSNNFLLPPNAGHLSVLRTPGADGSSGRARKCSIVQEEDDDEDEANRNDMSNPLNRRGSRSEGRINITVQDRLADTERLKKECAAKIVATAVAPARSVFDGICGVTILTSGDSDPKDKLGKIRPSMQRPIDFRPKTAVSVLKTIKQQAPSILATSASSGDNNVGGETNRDDSMDHSYEALNRCRDNDAVSTKFLTDASTISIPISSNQSTAIIGPPKYKTMPSPTRANTILPGANCLNEIFEEGTDAGSSDTSATNITTAQQNGRSSDDQSKMVADSVLADPNEFAGWRALGGGRGRNRSGAGTNATSSGGSAQRRSKFHKTRTASCSSSDDDDSENRKKRAHKIVDSTKPFQQQRRDSHDDSSDSQDPSNVTGSSGANSTSSHCVGQFADTQSTEQSQVNNANDGNTNGRQKTGQVAGFRRHRAGRRRAGETRLRESQSLNRITEVQESELPLASLLQTHHIPNSSPMQQTQPSSSSSSSLLTEPGTAAAATSGATTNEKNGSSNKNVPAPNAGAATSSSSSNLKSNKMGFSARLFHGFRKSENTSSTNGRSPNTEPKNHSNCHWNGNGHSTGSDEIEATLSAELAKALKVTSESKSSTAAKKLKMLGRYFQVHKKISIPLPGIFQRGRLYKAQSCSSIVRDKVVQSSSTNLNGNNGNNTTNVRHSALITDKNRILSNCLGARLLGGSDGDINQPQQFNTESDSLRIPVSTATLNVTNANESQTNGSNALFGVSPSNTKTRPLCNNNYLLADCPCVPSNAIVLR